MNLSDESFTKADDIFKSYPCYSVCPQKSCAECCSGYIECKIDQHQKKVRA